MPGAADVLVVDYGGETYVLPPARTWMHAAEAALADRKLTAALRAVLPPADYERFRRTATVDDISGFLSAAGVRVAANAQRNRPHDPRLQRRRRR